MPQKETFLRVASIVLMVMLVFAGLYAILLIVSPETVAEGTVKARTGLSLSGLSDKGSADAVIVQTRHIGVMALCVTIASCFVVFKAFRQKEKWAWYCILIVGLIVWGYGLVVQTAEGDVFNMVMHFIGLVLLGIGVLLPLGSFFGKEKG